MVVQQHFTAAHRGLVQFAHMLFQIEIATEPFRADFASVRFFVVVRVHVEGEIVNLCDDKRTQLLGISFS